ncbi:hypothetical protein CHLRE_16g662902v5 [Chlamydomonas reinhardtii]|uniref:Translation initiation factor eIF2B subunit beta n=1 Tax=Chlamydomonas reinhardtii TaxID=3055 RepID=A0A2K3CTN2_CHLRE|nr:uncharacterized protein CHLRE_16g662902v5 [Chlamydomonas reinhardtii]PNW71642.1 hypothetical protein CHLRE_16g662902v5 [Chlamydomonas reinhardtii]
MSEKKDIDELLEECCAVFRRRQIEGSLPCAKKTLDVLRLIVTNKRHSTAAALIDEIRTVGYKMQTARPVELAIGNMVRRVLHIIREEAKQEQYDEAKPGSFTQPANQEGPEAARNQTGLLSKALNSTSRVMQRGLSLSNLLDVGIDPALFAPVPSALTPIAEVGTPAERSELMERAAAAAGGAGGPGERAGGHGGGGAERDPELESQGGASSKPQGKQNKKTPPNWKGKHEVIESINELIDELDHIQGSITLQGVEHIHANEVILTMGMSDTTYLFLKEASKKREFQVVVAEGAPRFDGHLMARKLADAGITTTLIADSAVYAMMARANKVLVGAHAVLANGGVVAPVGLHMVALAARRHSIPFVVLVGLHKLSPLFPTDPELLYNEFKGPGDVIDFDVVAEAFAQQQQLAAAAAATAPSDRDGAAGGAAGSSSSGPSAGNSSDGPAAASSSSASGISLALAGGAGAFSSSYSAAAAVAAAAAGGAGGAGSGAPFPTVGGPPRWDPLPGNLHVPTPLFDYVPPHLISLFITDMGGRMPSYVYRLLTEYYARDDYFLSREVFGKER